MALLKAAHHHLHDIDRIGWIVFCHFSLLQNLHRCTCFLGSQRDVHFLGSTHQGHEKLGSLNSAGKGFRNPGTLGYRCFFLFISGLCYLGLLAALVLMRKYVKKRVGEMRREINYNISIYPNSLTALQA